MCDVTFSIAFFDAVVVRKNVNFSARISIEKIVSEDVDRKGDFFDSIRRVILPMIEKVSFSTALFDSIRNGLKSCPKKNGLVLPRLFFLPHSRTFFFKDTSAIASACPT